MQSNRCLPEGVAFRWHEALHLYEGIKHTMNLKEMQSQNALTSDVFFGCTVLPPLAFHIHLSVLRIVDSRGTVTNIHIIVDHHDYNGEVNIVTLLIKRVQN